MKKEAPTLARGATLGGATVPPWPSHPLVPRGADAERRGSMGLSSLRTLTPSCPRRKKALYTFVREVYGGGKVGRSELATERTMDTEQLRKWIVFKLIDFAANPANGIGSVDMLRWADQIKAYILSGTIPENAAEKPQAYETMPPPASPPPPRPDPIVHWNNPHLDNMLWCGLARDLNPYAVYKSGTNGAEAGVTCIGCIDAEANSHREMSS